MGTIIVKCPVTGLEYGTSIEIDEASFLRLSDIKVKSRCPHCGANHVWHLHEARISSEKLAGVTVPGERQRQPGN